MWRPNPRSWWGRLTLRAKTVLVAGVPIAVLGLAVPAMFAAQRDSFRVIAAVEHTYRLRQDLSDVLQDLVDAETGMRGFLLTNDQQFLSPYRDGLRRLPGDMAEVRQRLQADPRAIEHVHELEGLVDERLQVLDAIHRYAKRTPPGSIPYDLLAEGRHLMISIRSSLGQLDQMQAEVLTAQRSQLERSQHLTFALSVAVVPIMLLATSAALLAFVTGLVRRVRRIEENARRLEQGEPLLPPPSGDDELARLAHTLGHAAGTIAEQDAELRELALVDPLTGLHNRRAFQEIAEHELQVARRAGSVAALMFIDVDGMKRVNDALGHAEGDRLLQQAADVLGSSLRESDVIARLGGDEFCILLSRDTAMDGASVLQRLGREIARLNDGGDLPFVLSLSHGLAYFDPGSPVSVDELIRQADAAMYEHKRSKPEQPYVRSGAHLPATPDAPALDPGRAPASGSALVETVT